MSLLVSLCMRNCLNIPGRIRLPLAWGCRTAPVSQSGTLNAGNVWLSPNHEPGKQEIGGGHFYSHIFWQFSCLYLNIGCVQLDCVSKCMDV